MVPYVPRIGGKFKKLGKNKGIQVHYKGTKTLRTLLGNPKDKDPKNNQTGIIYYYKYPQINCPSAYIGESGRFLGERVKKHFKAPHPLTQHHHRTSYGPRTVQYSTQGSQQPFQDHQGGHVHLCSGLYPQQKPGRVPASAHMGQSSAGISYTTVQAIQPSSPHPTHLNPPTGSPLYPLPLPI